MWLSDTSVRRPVLATVMNLLLIAFGVVSYTRLQVREYPDIEPPIVSIGKAEADGAVSGYTDYGNQGRARVEARNEGALTLYAAAPDGVLIGADIAAPGAEHLGHLLGPGVGQQAQG